MPHNDSTRRNGVPLTDSDTYRHDGRNGDGSDEETLERVVALDELESETEADDRLVAHESDEQREDPTDGVLQAERQSLEQVMQRQSHDQNQRSHVVMPIDVVVVTFVR